MREQELRILYKRFLEFYKKILYQDIKSSAWFGLPKSKMNKSDMEAFFNSYEKISFFTFLKNIKDFIYLKNIFDFIKINSEESWLLELYLAFLKSEKIISINRNEKIIVARKGLTKIIPSFLGEKEIRKNIEKKLKTRISLSVPVSSVMKAKINPEYDQMPISFSSAIFIVKKILDYIPLNKKFLFVGDDDFISVFLSLANPNTESVVVDINKDTLKKIAELAKKYKLKIKTVEADITKNKKLKDSFVGFLTNPPYNFEGVKNFVNFGMSQLGKDGGFVFLEVGNESIDNKFLLLENFFYKKNLISKELIAGNIFYPFTEFNIDDQVIYRRLKRFFGEKAMRNGCELGAFLRIFEYLPFTVEFPKKQSIYTYL